MSFDETPVFASGKRCGLQWAPWMGDWFTSWSPRNGNSHAEGPWDHWVDFALKILQDPMTAKVRPEAHAAVKDIPTQQFYDESHVELSDEDLVARFNVAVTS